jgi:glycine oxidase
VSTFDVAIVGGGLIGASVAFELATENLRVVVIDRQKPGQEASWAAAGMLSPGPHSPEDESLTPLAKESLRLYPEFIAEVEKASGRSVSFLREGALEIFSGPLAVTDRDKMVASHQRLGLTAETISLEAALKLEKALGPTAGAAAWLPEEATVEPRMLMDAVLAGNAQRGVELAADCAVTSLICERSHAGTRCTGVFAGGKKIEAKFVVLAAGCFTGAIKCDSEGFRLSASLRPVRGQMIAFRPKGLRISRVLRSQRGYLVPRRDGRIVAGSTTEDAGFEKRVTREGLQSIVSAAVELVPELGDAEIVETWSGLRPGTADNLPILGPTGIEGLLSATGHFRNGILLAPVTAKLIKDWIVRGQVSSDVARFSPLRFDGANSEKSSAKNSPAIR